MSRARKRISIDIKCCLFHFTKALNDHVGKLGLQCAHRQNPVIKDYIRIIYGSALLPTFNNHADPLDIIKTFLEFYLNNPPVTCDQITDLALKSFIKYFRQQRMPINIFGINSQILCHVQRITLKDFTQRFNIVKCGLNMRLKTPEKLSFVLEIQLFEGWLFVPRD